MDESADEVATDAAVHPKGDEEIMLRHINSRATLERDALDATDEDAARAATLPRLWHVSHVDAAA